MVTPREQRPIQLGRVRVAFLYQQPAAFAQVNCSPWIEKIATPQGYTSVAGVELTLADCLRYPSSQRVSERVMNLAKHPYMSLQDQHQDQVVAAVPAAATT